MAFTVTSDWWGFLDARTDGTLATVFALGETEEDHPRVDRAAKYATAAIRNALLTRYPMAAVDAFTCTDDEADMLLHAGALAMYALTSTGSGRTIDLVTDNDNAEKWLTKVRSGGQPIARLAATSPVTSEEGRASGFVRYKGRPRSFSRRGDYEQRNPKI